MSRNKKTSIIANINLFLSYQQAPTINFTINSTKPCKTKLALLSNSSTRSFSSENYINSLRNARVINLRKEHSSNSCMRSNIFSIK